MHPLQARACKGNDAPLHDSDSMIVPGKQLPPSHSSIPFAQAPSSMAALTSRSGSAR